MLHGEFEAREVVTRTVRKNKEGLAIATKPTGVRLQDCKIALFHHSIIPLFLHSIILPFHYSAPKAHAPLAHRIPLFPIDYFPISVRIFSISSITRFIFFIVRSNGCDVVMSTPAVFKRLTG